MKVSARVSEWIGARGMGTVCVVFTAVWGPASMPLRRHNIQPGVCA